MPLNARQLAWIEHYLTHWNATRAAIDAGYSEQSARKQGSRMSTNVDIQAAIQARLAELKMSADEVLTRLTDHARGSVAPFLVTNAAGVPTGFNLSPDKPLHLVKKVSITDKGISFEVYDAQSALALLGKHHGIFTEKIEQSGSTTIEIRYADDSEPEAPA
ncbi:MAG TPA: terminase small subunit [Burkholderiales bacterium]|nr:terminase small subunit [Burkholderiales bacterium]